MAKINHPITFIDKLVEKNELGEPCSLKDHQRTVLIELKGKAQNLPVPWDAILYSCIKSGKTTLHGAIALAWGFTQ